MRRSVLDELLEARASKVPFALLTHLPSGRQALFRGAGPERGGDFGPEVASAARDALRRDRSRRDRKSVV